MQPELFALLKEYSSLVPARLLGFPKDVVFVDLNSFLVESILENEHLQKYPPSSAYQKSFWKAAISQLERLASDNDDEIDNRILEHYLSLLPPSAPPAGSTNADLRDKICGLGLPLHNAPSKSFITHFWSPSQHGDTLSRISSRQASATDLVDTAPYVTSTLRESRTTIESGTTGLRTWGASFKLAEYLIAHPHLVERRTILELGSGIGFLGIIAATLQALSCATKPIWLTDINDEVLSLGHYNVTLPCNLSSSHNDIHYRKLDWFDALSGNKDSLHHFIHESNPETILGADIIFDPDLIKPLLATLSLILHSTEPAIERTAIIAATIRNIDTFRMFLSTAKEYDLAVDDLLNDGIPQPPKQFIETAESGGGSPTGFRILKLQRINT